MTSPWLALSPGVDPTQLARQIARDHDQFVSSATSSGAVRSVVLDSWTRSVANGIDVDHGIAPVEFTDHALAEYRDRHPLAEVMPVVRRLLVEDAAECGLLVAVSDADGRLLWVEGSAALRAGAEAFNFVPGARWDEAHAGTNAPGTALAIDHGVQVFSHEHFMRVVQPWSCTAAPIHDPFTGAILGALDVTGKESVATPQAMALVQATIYAIETHLRITSTDTARRTPSSQSTKGTPSTSSSARSAPGHRPPRLAVLGTHGGELRSHRASMPLSLRHAEILLLLLLHPAGLTTDQLAVELSDTEGFPVTVRAEISRIRRILGDLAPHSKPYRLPVAFDSDVADVQAALRAGHIDQALASYSGPILPRSDAPGVIRARCRLNEELRAAVLSSDNPAHLLSWGHTSCGADDFEVWTAAAQRLPAGSQEQTLARLRLAGLEQEFGSSSVSSKGNTSSKSVMRTT